MTAAEAAGASQTADLDVGDLGAGWKVDGSQTSQRFGVTFRGC